MGRDSRETQTSPVAKGVLRLWLGGGERKAEQSQPRLAVYLLILQQLFFNLMSFFKKKEVLKLEESANVELS